MDHREALVGHTEQTRGWLAGICAATRVENQAVAAQLVAIGGLFADRLARSAETEQWAIDTMEAVAAEVAAGLRISQRRAQTKLRWARAMRERVPKVAALFCAGDIDFCAFATVVSRTDLITDAEVLARVDGLVAANLTRWPSLTAGRLAGKVDAIVAGLDADAVRRRQDRAVQREVCFSEDHEGITYLEGGLFTPDARALDARLTALAATVCPHDPRTTAQRRADALGALGAGADRLGCRCGRTECTAGQRTPTAAVVIHVIAEQATLAGAGTTPASLLEAGGLITPEVLAELAAGARQVPLIHPGYRPPEPGYRPSAALADFVRCRDLTCRWPGCEVPASRCDVDHTIPYAQGGPTHAGNLKCYCRTHHLVKSFWGWREKQLADGTLILTSPAGEVHVSTPGSALLFPSLCAAVGGMPSPETETPADYCAERNTMMPRRRRTRAQHHAARVAAERRHNRQTRHAAGLPDPTPAYNPDTDYWHYAACTPPSPDDEPPPF
nr:MULTISPECIES: HNH endonuclease signature motif containing protein [Mycobacterium]